MAKGLIYSASFDAATNTLSLTDKVGNLIYSCVLDISPSIIDDPTKPLYLLSKQDGSTIYLGKGGGTSYVNDTTFERSVDGTVWADIALGSANAITLDRGEGVYLRAKDTRTRFPSGLTEVPVCIRMSGEFEAYHNCYSMLTPNFATLTDLSTIGGHCLQCLFAPGSVSSSTTARNTSLTKAPLLPATVLSPGCYAHLFHFCTALVQAPPLPAVTIAESCYNSMFKFCTSLVQAPALPATTLVEFCYYAMFDNTALTKAPDLPATTLLRSSYAWMFNGCSNLNEVHISASSISASDCLRSWMSGVSSTGDFYCVEGVEYPTDSASGIPQGWTKLSIE